MGNSLYGQFGINGQVASASGFSPIINGTSNIPVFAVQNSTKIPVAVSGIFNALSGQFRANNGDNFSMFFQKNGVNAHQNITFSGTGSVYNYITDTTNLDFVNPGDQVNLIFQGSGTSPMARGVDGAFSGIGQHAAIYAASGALTVNQFFIIVGGAGGSTTSESAVSLPVYTPGILKGFFFNAAANTLTQSATLITRISATSGTQTLTIGSGITGIFQDTTHTDVVVSGSLIAGHIASTGTGTITGLTGVTFIPTNGVANEVYGTLPGGEGFNNASGAITYVSIFGIGAFSSAQPYIEHGFLVETSNWTVDNGSNSLVGTATQTAFLVKNGVPCNQSITMASGITGFFRDTTHTDIFLPTDQMCWAVSGQGTGGVDYGAVMLTESAGFPILQANQMLAHASQPTRQVSRSPTAALTMHASQPTRQVSRTLAAQTMFIQATKPTPNVAVMKSAPMTMQANAPTRSGARALVGQAMTMTAAALRGSLFPVIAGLQMVVGAVPPSIKVNILAIAKAAISATYSVKAGITKVWNAISGASSS